MVLSLSARKQSQRTIQFQATTPSARAKLGVLLEMGLYNAVLLNCDLIFRKPGEAQANSTAITFDEGIRFRLPVPGYPPYKIFWSPEGPTIEAIPATSLEVVG